MIKRKPKKLADVVSYLEYLLQVDISNITAMKSIRKFVKGKSDKKLLEIYSRFMLDYDSMRLKVGSERMDYYTIRNTLTGKGNATK